MNLFKRLRALTLLILVQACASSQPTQLHLQWSEPAQHVSSDGQWRLVVEPELNSRENSTPVYVEDEHGNRSRIMTLGRRADAFWTPHGLVIVNEPGEGESELRVYNLVAHPTAVTFVEKNVTPDILDIVREQTSTSNVNHLYISDVILRDSVIHFSVRGDYSLADGPSQRFCYRLRYSYPDLRVLQEGSDC